MLCVGHKGHGVKGDEAPASGFVCSLETKILALRVGPAQLLIRVQRCGKGSRSRSQQLCVLLMSARVALRC